MEPIRSQRRSATATVGQVEGDPADPRSGWPADPAISTKGGRVRKVRIRVLFLDERKADLEAFSTRRIQAATVIVPHRRLHRRESILGPALGSNCSRSRIAVGRDENKNSAFTIFGLRNWPISRPSRQISGYSLWAADSISRDLPCTHFLCTLVNLLIRLGLNRHGWITSNPQLVVSSHSGVQTQHAAHNST